MFFSVKIDSKLEWQLINLFSLPLPEDEYRNEKFYALEALVGHLKISVNFKFNNVWESILELQSIIHM